MLNVKEFERALQSVNQEEILRKKVRGMYVPYIEAIARKARTLPAGKSVEVDLQDRKEALRLSMALRHYLDKTNMDDLASGNYKTFVFCGKRSDQKNGGK